jgi:hypothetical protein
MEIKTDASYSLDALRGKVGMYLFILETFSGSDIVYFGEMERLTASQFVLFHDPIKSRGKINANLSDFLCCL